MIGGVNFQPGSLDQEQQRRQQSQGSAQGVQEAIKVLSLRLPKVVGAQSIAPSALLNSQGGGGSPHVDSIVESVMAKMFPGAAGGNVQAPMEQPQAPSMAPESSPQFSGQVRQGSEVRQDQPPQSFQFPQAPRVIMDRPSEYLGGVGSVGDFTIGGPQSPNTGGSQPPAMIGQMPDIDLRKYLDWVPQGPGRDYSNDPPMI